MALPYVEINGNKYMSSKKAEELWGKKQTTISKLCKNGKIPPSRCFKDDHSNWYIDTKAIYPLTIDQIRKILSLTVQLKNNPKHVFDWSTYDISSDNIRAVYDYLLDLNYILPYQIEDCNRLPYDIVLTEKGINLVTYRGKSHNRTNLIESSAQWVSVILQVGQIILQMRLNMQ